MQEKEKLFHKILRALDAHDLLSRLVLVGSWCQPIYAHIFGNAPEIPALRTTDIDFLIPVPPQFPKNVDLPRIFSQLGFELVLTALQNSYIRIWKSIFLSLKSEDPLKKSSEWKIFMSYHKNCVS